MKPYTVEFIGHRSITTMVPMLDAYKFKPQDTNLLLALECGQEEMTPNAKSDGADAVLSRTLPLD